MRGKQWSAEMDEVLVCRYADEESVALAREFGYGVRTVERHAASLGLKKSPELLLRVARKASAAAAEWVKRKRERGEKIEKRWGGHGFEKGHRFEGEVEARRVASIRGPRGKKVNLEKCRDMSKFVRKMRTDELERLLKEKMGEVYAIRQELDRRRGESLESEMGRRVNFEDYVSER